MPSGAFSMRVNAGVLFRLDRNSKALPMAGHRGLVRWAAAPGNCLLDCRRTGRDDSPTLSIRTATGPARCNERERSRRPADRQAWRARPDWLRNGLDLGE